MHGSGLPSTHALHGIDPLLNSHLTHLVALHSSAGGGTKWPRWVESDRGVLCMLSHTASLPVPHHIHRRCLLHGLSLAIIVAMIECRLRVRLSLTLTESSIAGVKNGSGTGMLPFHGAVCALNEEQLLERQLIKGVQRWICCARSRAHLSPTMYPEQRTCCLY